MNSRFRDSLHERYPDKVAKSRLSNAARVERYYGDLDEHFARDRLRGVLSALQYIVDDKKHGTPNHTKVVFERHANLYEGLATLRASLALYIKFGEERT